jgi:hypothetical protein
MKWTKPKNREQRDNRSFLLFPKNINGEVRWLEVASWHEWYDYDHWVPCYWITEEELPDEQDV